MTAFDYLAVLISIILGLGLANCLNGAAAIARARGRVTLYPPTLIQLFNVFLIHVQTWWTMFGLRGIAHWNFLMFLLVLMQPILLFLASAVIVPDIPAQGAVDLKPLYFRERAWFYGLFGLVVAVSACRNIVINGGFTAPELAAHAIFAAMTVMALASRSARLHAVLAPLLTLILAVYIGFLFMDLR